MQHQFDTDYGQSEFVLVERYGQWRVNVFGEIR